MKAIHLVPAMDQGGVESVVCDLNRALAGAGHESIVVSRGGRLAARIVRDGGRHVEMDLKSKNPLTFPVRALALRAALKKLSDGGGPAVVCTHSRVPAWLFAFAGRGLGLPWISYAHGANSVSRYSAVMTFGDMVVAPSKFLAEYLMANYRDASPGHPPLASRLRVIPNAVDLERFDPARTDADFVAGKRREWGLSDGEFVVMAAGRLSPLKGYDTLIKAFAAAERSASGRGMRLVIVGGAERGREGCERRLRRLAADVCASPRSVVFAGRQEKMPECYSIASAVVSSNSVKPESFGLSIAEAIAMGRPVVAKAFGGAAEIIEDGATGLLIDGDGAEFERNLADAIAKIASGAVAFDGDRLRKSIASRFNFGIMSAGTLSAYAELADAGRNHGASR